MALKRPVESGTLARGVAAGALKGGVGFGGNGKGSGVACAVTAGIHETGMTQREFEKKREANRNHVGPNYRSGIPIAGAGCLIHLSRLEPKNCNTFPPFQS